MHLIELGNADIPHLSFGRLTELWLRLPLATLRAAALGGFGCGIFFLALVFVSSRDSVIRGAFAGRVARYDAMLAAQHQRPRGEGMVILEALGGVCVLIGAAATGKLALLCALPLVIAPGMLVRRAAAKRRQVLANQIPEFAQNLSNALQATASIGDAVRSTQKITPSPLGQELQILLRQMDIGSTLGDGLQELGARLALGPVDVVISAILIGLRTGGSISDVLGTVAGSLRENRRIEEQTRKVLDGPRKAFSIGLLMSGALVVGPLLVIPSVGEMLTTRDGRVLVGTLVGGFAVAAVMARHILRTRVI